MSKMIQYRLEQKRLAIQYKGGICELCGYSKYLRAMEFQNNDGKSWDIGNMAFAKVKDLLDSHTLLCANCRKAERYGKELIQDSIDDLF